MDERVAICFMSENDDITNSQLSNINFDKLNFKFEIYKRHEYNNSLYLSFSQMINDAINETESEIMVFINPKTKFNEDDLNELYGKLNNGYCFVSLFGFAFFATTKELFRHVGLLDERFLGSEYEDDDFLLRLIIFNKKIYWGQNWEKYNFKFTYHPPHRGSSLTEFWKKWRLKDNKVYITDEFIKNKKISKRHSKFKNYIFESWKEGELDGEGHIWHKIKNYEIVNNVSTIEKKIIDFNVDVSLSNKQLYVNFLCNENISISISIIKNYDSERYPVYAQLIHNNNWYVFENLNNSHYELRIFHEGNIIYMNKIMENDNLKLNFSLPSTILITT